MFRIKPLPLLSGTALQRYFEPVKPTLKTKMDFWVSEGLAQKKSVPVASKNKNKKEDYLYDEVLPHVYLGTIVREENMRSIIDRHGFINKNHQLHVFSIVDSWELGQEKEVQPQVWKKFNVIPHLVPVTDFASDITPESILATVYQMRQILEVPGNSIYIHCKAGKARSAMIVATYIALFGKDHLDKLHDQINPDLPEIIQAAAYLKLNRSQVSLHQELFRDFGSKHRLHDINKMGKLQKAQAAIDLHHNLLGDIGKDNMASDDIISEFNKYMRQRNWPTDRTPVGTMSLATLQFKNELIQTPAFQQLLVMVGNSDLSANAREAIRKLLKNIYCYNSHETNDANWRIDLKNLHMNQDASPELKKVLGELISFTNKYVLAHPMPEFILENKKQQTSQLINQYYSVARKLQSSLIENPWPQTSRHLHNVSFKNDSKKNRIPTPAKNILNILESGLSPFNVDNTMALPLKRIAAIGLVECHSSRNHNNEQHIYAGFADLVDAEKSLAAIKMEIEQSNFPVHGRFENKFGISKDKILTTEGKTKTVPRNIARAYAICNQQGDPMEKLIRIMGIFKHNPRNQSLITRFFRHDITENFYRNAERHLVLKTGNDLQQAVDQVYVPRMVVAKKK